VLTPFGIAEKTRLASGFLKRKREEYAQLKAEIEAVQCDLVEMLNDKTSGFATSAFNKGGSDGRG
jgi:hypothetical protein